MYFWSSFLPSGFLQLWRVGTILQLQCLGSLVQWLLLWQNTGSGARGLPQLQCTGLVAPQCVESSCILGRWILNHWTTREVQGHPDFKFLFLGPALCPSFSIPLSCFTVVYKPYHFQKLFFVFVYLFLSLVKCKFHMNRALPFR